MTAATTHANSEQDQHNEPNLDRHGHTRPRYDDVNIPVVVLVGVISSIVTMLIIAFVQGLCLQWENSLIDLNSRQDAYPGVTAVIESQKEKLEANPSDGRLSVEAVIPDILAKYQNDSHEDHGAGDGDSHENEGSGEEHESSSDDPH